MDARSFYWKPENHPPEAETAEYRESVPGDILFDFDSWTDREGVCDALSRVAEKFQAGHVVGVKIEGIYGPSWRAGV